jgi:hypothetical protein
VTNSSKIPAAILGLPPEPKPFSAVGVARGDRKERTLGENARPSVPEHEDSSEISI